MDQALREPVPSVGDGISEPNAGSSHTLVEDLLAALHAEFADVTEGTVADYIPELGKADPNWFGIAMTTIDGKTYGVGDAEQPFTIQSVSKPFNYGYSLREYGQEAVLKQVGVEPTGEAFNSILLNEKRNQPFNPMVNAGAIAISGMVKGDTFDERYAAMLEAFADFAGRTLEIDEAVYLSEHATGHRNRAIAYLMLNSGMIDGNAEETLDLYFRQCSILVTARDLSVMAATLANGGVNPITGKRVLEEDHVRDVLSVMSTCGMYDYAGQWAFEVGMPAKSGVSGAVIAVVPGQVGICAFSPRLDEFGNSVRAVRLFQRLSQEFGLHTQNAGPGEIAVIRRLMRGDEVRSKRVRTPKEVSTLDRLGQQIACLELQGALYFGSGERIVRAVSELPDEASYVILDFRRVRSVDAAGVLLLRHLCRAALGQGRRIILSHLQEAGPLAELHAAISPLCADGRLSIRASMDLALETFENTILRTEPDMSDRSKLSFSQLDIFRGLSRAECQLLEEIVRPMRFETGQTIFREGEPAHLFFVLASGSVTVSLTTPGAPPRRLAGLGPGMTFGEMALLDGGTRSADVTADGPVICYGFSVDSLNDLGQAHPNIMITILRNLTRDFSDRLRRANREIRALQ